MASSLYDRVRALESAIAMVSEIMERLRYSSPATGVLLRQLAASERYERLGFLKECRRAMETGRAFPESWRCAVHNRRRALGRDAAELLSSMGGILGSADLDSQISALACTCEMLEVQLENARRHSSRCSRMYRAMGVLGGAALVILLI